MFDDKHDDGYNNKTDEAIAVIIITIRMPATVFILSMGPILKYRTVCRSAHRGPIIRKSQRKRKWKDGGRRGAGDKERKRRRPEQKMVEASTVSRNFFQESFSTLKFLLYNLNKFIGMQILENWLNTFIKIFIVNYFLTWKKKKTEVWCFARWLSFFLIFKISNFLISLEFFFFAKIKKNF